MIAVNGGLASADETADAAGSLERAAARLLRKRGYEVVPPEETEFRADVQAAGGGKLYVLRAAASALIDTCRWASKLGSWAGGSSIACSSSAVLQTEFCAVLLPALLHLFVALADAGQLKEAKELMEATRDSTWLFRSALAFTHAHGSQAAFSEAAKSLLEHFRFARAWPIAELEVEDGPLERLRQEERITVAVSPLARELLCTQMLRPESAALVDVLQRCVRLVVAGSTDESDSAATACSVLPEILDAETKRINAEPLVCEVDVTDPPCAYGNAWQRTEPAPSDNRKVPRYSAAGYKSQRGLPLPAVASRTRLIASSTFARDASLREDIKHGHLPVVAAYVIGGDADDDINCCSISSHGRLCVVGSRSSLRFWDFDASTENESGASSEPNGSKDRTKASMPRATPLVAHRGRVLCTSISPDHEMLLSGGHDGALCLWNLPHRVPMCTFKHHGDPIWAADWCATGHYFVSSGSGNQALLWSVESSVPLRVFAQPDSLLSCVAQSGVDVVRAHPSGRHVVTATNEMAILWDVAAAQAARIFPGVQRATSLAVSADGKLLATGREDGCVDVWDISTGRRYFESVQAHDGTVRALEFSWPTQAGAAGSLLISGGMDGAIKLWSTTYTSRGAGAVVEPLAAPLRASGGRAPPVLAGRFTSANALIVACASV
eukprot:TRINITY_DN14268_c0_g4_i1.p1 TRINITY_DN14268_c0_g4~~TRINITY_DN14268_c0_g4_i1.p1  ORF type:complete len:678 (-),score=84.97 TRINITY_DN14268_c0_g4_i1:66-2066(-)